MSIFCDVTFTAKSIISGSQFAAELILRLNNMDLFGSFQFCTTTYTSCQLVAPPFDLPVFTQLILFLHLLD